MNAAPRITDAALLATVILLGSVTGWFVLRRQPNPAPSRKNETPVAVAKSAEKKTPPLPASARPVMPESAQATAPPSAPPRKGKPPIWDTAARDALKQVGADAEAERYWLSAINNPVLPPIERQDLIEDLNEDGLSDPRNPGVIDLPLINARIRLIEQLMPDAMDRVNAEAFKEAHKDLVKMRAKLDG
jgi:hypothetical protein